MAPQYRAIDHADKVSIGLWLKTSLHKRTGKGASDTKVIHPPPAGGVNLLLHPKINKKCVAKCPA